MNRARRAGDHQLPQRRGLMADGVRQQDRHIDGSNAAEGLPDDGTRVCGVDRIEYVAHLETGGRQCLGHELNRDDRSAALALELQINDALDLRERGDNPIAPELYRPAAEEKNQVLQEKIDAGLAVKGDRELLMQLFANLIENAVRHAPSEARLEVWAATAGDRVEVGVTDDGPGIPANMHAKVMQRFLRLETSRTTPGSGLGLSMSLAIVNLHDATLVLADNRPGLRATVSLSIRG
jgi:signal transduction histidine kinase